MHRVQSRPKCGMVLNCHTSDIILPKLVAQWTLFLRSDCLLKYFVAAQLRPTLILRIRTSEYIDWGIIQLIFAHNHLAQWVNAWYRSERNCPPLNLRTSPYLLLIIQHAWLINSMSLVKGMTFKMSQAAKTVGKEHFRRRCRAQGIPLYFSRIDHKWSLVFGEGQRFERHATRGDNFARSSISSLNERLLAANFVCHYLYKAKG